MSDEQRTSIAKWGIACVCLFLAVLCVSVAYESAERAKARAAMYGRDKCECGKKVEEGSQK